MAKNDRKKNITHRHNDFVNNFAIKRVQGFYNGKKIEKKN